MAPGGAGDSLRMGAGDFLRNPPWGAVLNQCSFQCETLVGVLLFTDLDRDGSRVEKEQRCVAMFFLSLFCDGLG